MPDLFILKNALSRCANIPQEVLEHINPSDDLLFFDEYLLKILLENNGDDHQGKLIQKINWQNPNIDFDDFSVIKERQLTITMNTLFDNYGDMADNAFYNDNDEYSLDEMIAGYEKHRQHCLAYFNEQLAPYQLRIAELVFDDKSYILLVNDYMENLERLIKSLAKFNVVMVIE